MGDNSTEPKWLTLARSQLGTHEVPGPGNNPTVVEYYLEAAGKKQPDVVPWCAAFVGAMLHRAGVKPTGSLWARSYLNWGKKLTKPQVGCITVFARGPISGHVAFFLADEGSVIKVLGGNQSDAVTIARQPKRRLLGYRWPT